MICNDWALSNRNADLTTELEVRHTFEIKFDLITAVKQCYIKISLHYKVQLSTTTYVQLQCIHESTCQWYLCGGISQEF